MNNLSNFIDSRYDEDFSKIEELIWKPFIGKNYNNLDSKILIVGESHYVPDNEDSNGYEDEGWTRMFIAKEGLQEYPWYSGTQKNNLVREIEKTIVGTENFSKEVGRKFWNSVSYYNFVQRLLTSRDNRPTYNDLISGWEVNFQVCKILQPDIIIFCGVESSKHFSFMNDKFLAFESSIIEITNEKINRTYPRAFNLEHDGKKTVCLFIKHPSAGYTWRPWSNILNEIAKERILEFRNYLNKD